MLGGQNHIKKSFQTILLLCLRKDRIYMCKQKHVRIKDSALTPSCVKCSSHLMMLKAALMSRSCNDVEGCSHVQELQSNLLKSWWSHSKSCRGTFPYFKHAAQNLEGYAFLVIMSEFFQKNVHFIAFYREYLLQPTFVFGCFCLQW